jgi:hypothetical protein
MPVFMPGPGSALLRLAVRVIVYREKAGAKGEPEKIADSIVPVEWHMYLNRAAAQGVQYEYSVASVNINNVEGKRSNPFLIRRDARPPIPPDGVQVRQTTKGVVVQQGARPNNGGSEGNLWPCGPAMDWRDRPRCRSGITSEEIA